jgi:hypothetical protein
MAKGYKARGGNPLNFKVVGGTTEPTNPKENMIWVDTNIPISSWEFSTVQPTGVTGRVWFKTSLVSSTPFNALKKNNLQVYPSAVMQYVDGAWLDKSAKIYQGGKWVNLARYIFNSGIVNEGGSWRSVISNGYITQDIDLPQQARKIFTHDEPVNVSGCTKATFVIKSSNPVYTYTEVGIYSESGYAASLTPIAFANSDTYAPDTDTELSFTIPSGVTQCYFGFGVNRVNTGTATTTLSVKSIKVE